MGVSFKRILIGGIFLAVVASVGFQGVGVALFVLSPMRMTKPEGAIIEVRKGMNPPEVTRALIASGALSASDERTFILVGRLGGFWKRIKAGEYKITPQMTPPR
jgi:cell division protein YceG involved in septum cleavage